MPATPLTTLPVQDYLSRLASSEPAPGGGSAAALTGALAAALGHMVCELTRGRPKFAAVESEITTLADRFERARAALTALVNEDAEAYLGLHASFSIEKANPQRGVRIQEAALTAAAAPLATAELAARMVQAIERLEQIGNPNLRADMTAARALADGARSAALANVRANVPLLAPDAAQRINQEVTALERAGGR